MIVVYILQWLLRKKVSHQKKKKKKTVRIFSLSNREFVMTLFISENGLRHQ